MALPPSPRQRSCVSIKNKYSFVKKKRQKLANKGEQHPDCPYLQGGNVKPAGNGEVGGGEKTQILLFRESPVRRCNALFSSHRAANLHGEKKPGMQLENHKEARYPEVEEFIVDGESIDGEFASLEDDDHFFVLSRSWRSCGDMTQVGFFKAALHIMEHECFSVRQNGSLSKTSLRVRNAQRQRKNFFRRS